MGQRLRYAEFKAIAASFPPAIRDYYFRPCTFLRMLLPDAAGGAIYIHQFYNYVVRRGGCREG